MLRYNSKMIPGALRRLARRPGVAAAVIFTLALGLGAATCLFSVANGLLLRPLPYPDSERLVALSTVDTQTGRAQRSSLQDVQDWAAQAQGLASVAAYWPIQTILRGDGDTAAVRKSSVGMSMVTPQFFAVLEARTLLGRTLERERDAVIGYQLWQERFGGQTAVLGRTLALESGAYTVTGVMPREFRFQDGAAVWVPLASYHADTRLQARDGRYLLAVGRLKKRVGLGESQASLDVISRHLAEAYPDTNGTAAARIESLHDVTVRSLRPYVRLLLALGGALWLISCGNAANLLLGQAARRRHEFAVRFALGASRLRIVRQLLAESLLLGWAGGALGMAAAYWGVTAVEKLIPVPLPGGLRLDVDLQVLAFNLTLSLSATVCFGLAPALLVSRRWDRASFSVAGRRLNNIVMGAEMALSVILLVSAALLVKTFSNLEAIDPGFRQDHLAIAHVLLGQPGNRVASVRSMLEAVRALPGVVAAGGANTLPYSQDAGLRGSLGRGGPLVSTATPGYFAAMGIPLVDGRDFAVTDTAGSAPVAIVSHRVARELGPDRTIKLDRLRAVVGVVGDVKYSAQETGGGEVYLCDGQAPPGHLHIVVRTAGGIAGGVTGRMAGNPQALAGRLRAALTQAAPDAPVTSVKTILDLREELFWQPRLWSLLGTLFAAIAAVLAAVGVFAVVGLSVTEGRRELGIRSALGARRGQIFRAVLAGAMRPVAAGLFAGTVAAAGFARLLAGLLFGVQPGDSATLIAMPLVLLTLALAACGIPARRAAQVDPAEVLRE
jgi:predicted permease